MSRWRPTRKRPGACLRRRSLPGARAAGSCSGATSSSMASNTDDTCSLTSPSWTGSRSRSSPQASRWEREKAERAWMGPREPGSCSYASLQQPVALRGVVPHAGQGAADLAEGLVVQGAAAAALHQPASLAEPGGGVVEVGPAALVVAVGEAELEVLDAALEAVERVTGQGVGAGGGDSAEGARGHADAESARGEALGEPGTRPKLLQWARPVGAAGPGERCSGSARSVAPPPAVPSWSMASNAATSWARWTTLTSGSSSGLGSASRPEARASKACPARSVPRLPGLVPNLRAARPPCPARTAPPGPGRRRSPAGAPIRSRSLAAPPLVMTVDSPGGPEGCTP